MYKLFGFIAKHSHWFLFLFLELLCGILLYQRAMFQRSFIFNSAASAVAAVSTTSGNIHSYIDLREKNRDLTERNSLLEMQFLALQRQLRREQPDTLPDMPGERGHYPYHTAIAKVISNSVTHTANYITIDKGKADNIAQDMGVISDYGVVGIISHVSEHFAVVLPILNPRHRMSCKLLRTGYFGSLGWDGKDARYAQLGELPRHAEVEVGDTVVTSGYSAIFPEGLLVGIVREYDKYSNESFHSANVELSVDLAALSDVHVVLYEHAQERQELLKEATRQ
jgi:rod shape-determining protein MreC